MHETAGAPTQARIIYNPAAAGGRERNAPLRSAAGILAQHGWTVSWRETEAAGHAEALAAEAAAEGVKVVVVAGGDGTINEAVNGLVGTDTALGVLPAGTGNVMAAELGLVGVPTPLHRPDLPAAAAAMCRGEVRRVDTGFAQPRAGPGRHFLLWAGIGIDAAVAHAMEGEARDLKRLFGPAAFGAVGLKTVLEAVGTSAIIRTDGEKSRGRLLLGVIANISLYGGTVQLTPDARVDDGLLDVELFMGNDVLATIGHLGAVLTGQRDAGERVSRRARRVRIVSSEPLRVHLDAEPFGQTPMSFVVRPGSLWVVVPPGANERLFGAPRA